MSTPPKTLMELIAARQKQNDQKGRQRTAKLQVGSNRIRILPSNDPINPEFFHDFGQHFIKGSDNQVKAIYVCDYTTFGKPCAVCHQLSVAVKNTNNDADVKLLEAAKTSKRVLVNALILTTGVANPNEPVVLEIPPTVFAAYISLLQADKWTHSLLSIDEGHDLLIDKSGAGMLTKYSVQPAPKSTKVPAAVLAKCVKLTDYVAQESAESVSRAISAIASVVGISAPEPREISPQLNHLSQRALSAITPDEVEDVTVLADEDDEALRELEIKSTATIVEKKAKEAVKTTPAPELEKITNPELLALMSDLTV